MSSSNNNLYQQKLTIRKIQKLVDGLPEEEKIIISKKLSKETFKKRVKAFTKKIKSVNLSDEDIINEVKTVRKGMYENERKPKNSG